MQFWHDFEAVLLWSGRDSLAIQILLGFKFDFHEILIVLSIFMRFNWDSDLIQIIFYALKIQFSSVLTFGRTVLSIWHLPLKMPGYRWPNAFRRFWNSAKLFSAIWIRPDGFATIWHSQAIGIWPNGIFAQTAWGRLWNDRTAFSQIILLLFGIRGFWPFGIRSYGFRTFGIRSFSIRQWLYLTI